MNLNDLYSRGVHPVARVIKLQDKTPVRNIWQMCLLSVLIDHITTCFSLYMWPSSGNKYWLLLLIFCVTEITWIFIDRQMLVVKILDFIPWELCFICKYCIAKAGKLGSVPHCCKHYLQNIIHARWPCSDKTYAHCSWEGCSRCSHSTLETAQWATPTSIADSRVSFTTSRLSSYTSGVVDLGCSLLAVWG
jgi:hypothetical protein